MAFHSRDQLFAALKALGAWLEEQPPESIGDRLELFVCGGASFLFHDLPRYLGVTHDVDVWCRFEHDEIVSISQWPQFFEKGIAMVRSQVSSTLPQDWLNCEA